MPWVLLLSAIFGAVGGWASARRNGIRDVDDMLTHSVSMALFGASLAMAGYWYFAGESSSGYLLIGISGFCGLVGLPIFEPLSELATEVISAIRNWIVKRLESWK